MHSGVKNMGVRIIVLCPATVPRARTEKWNQSISTCECVALMNNRL